jgi:hypothetical protein
LLPKDVLTALRTEAADPKHAAQQEVQRALAQQEARNRFVNPFTQAAIATTLSVQPINLRRF